MSNHTPNVPPVRAETPEDNVAEAIAGAAVEIVAECRAALGLPKGARLTEAVRWIAGGGPEAGLWEEYDAMAEEYWACIRRDDMLAADAQRKIMDDQQRRIRAARQAPLSAPAGSGVVRCPTRNEKGQQCGDMAGHDGEHTSLIASEFLPAPHPSAGEGPIGGTLMQAA